MIFQGSKYRYKDALLNIMLGKNRERVNDYDFYIEPFGGGMNVINYCNFPVRIAYDNDPFLIGFWKGLQKGYMIPINDMTEERYYALKEINDMALSGKLRISDIDDHTLFLIGTYRFLFSFNGKPFDGYNGGKIQRGNSNRDYAYESYLNVCKQVYNTYEFMNITYEFMSYDNIYFPPGSKSIVYCDPPAMYSRQPDDMEYFDIDYFHEWARMVRKLGNTVYLTGFDAPNDFIEIWSTKVVSSQQKQDKKTEQVLKLFTL